MLINSLIFLKTFNFNVKETIRYQLKTSKCLIITTAKYRMALRPVFIQFLTRLQKEQQIEITNKNSIETCEKTLSKP